MTRPTPRRKSPVTTANRKTAAARPAKSAPVAPAKQAPPAPAPAATSALLDIDDAIALLRTSRPTFYRWLREGKIRGDRAGKQWRFRREDLERFLAGETPRVDLPVSLEPLLDDLAKRITAANQTPITAADALTTVAQRLLQLTIATGASDLHIDYTGGDTARARLRIDGVLHDTACYDRRLHPVLIERLKTLASCIPTERQRPQDGRVNLQLQEHTHTMGFTFLPALLGESLTVRRMSQSNALVDIRPHLPARVQARFQRIIDLPWGMVLVVGPTSSGKTTTLYSVMQHAAKPGVKVISIEDPVMYQFPGIVQIPINPQVQFGFAQALRSALRSDPDLLVIGELRDLETIELAEQAAITGHLVLTQMHTAHAAAALTRLVELGSPPVSVSEAVKFVLAQRLVRRVCPDCSVPATLSPETLVQIRQSAAAGGLDPALFDNATFRQSVGCPRCGQTGYRGRLPAVELLEVTPEIAAALRHNATPDELRTIAIRQGMTSLHAEGLLMAAAGKTTLEEINRVMAG